MVPNSRQSLINTDLFLENKYFDWYVNIVESRINDTPEVYTEKHHILPKSLGGSNESSNLVRLTAREHFIVHLLLTKCMSTKNGYHKMVTAAHRLIYGNDHKYVYNSRLYESVKVIHSKVASEKFKNWWNSLSEDELRDYVERRRQSLIGHTCPDSTKQAVGKANTGNKYRLGIKHTEDSILKIKKNRRGKGLGKKWYHSVELGESTLAEECPEGFKPGRLPGQVKPSYGAKGKRWYYHPVMEESAYVVPGNEPEGYIPGRIIQK